MGLAAAVVVVVFVGVVTAARAATLGRKVEDAAQVLAKERGRLKAIVAVGRLWVVVKGRGLVGKVECVAVVEDGARRAEVLSRAAVAPEILLVAECGGRVVRRGIRPGDLIKEFGFLIDGLTGEVRKEGEGEMVEEKDDDEEESRCRKATKMRTTLARLGKGGRRRGRGMKKERSVIPFLSEHH